MRSIEAMRLDVERRMRRGERFTDVEDVINASDLAADEKAALWLLGWSYVHPRAQRREANAHLAALMAATPRPTSISRRALRVVPYPSPVAGDEPRQLDVRAVGVELQPSSN